MAATDQHVQGTEPLLTLLRQLFEVSAAINASVREVLADFELTESMSGLLWMLDPDRPPLRMREIARALGCDPSNVTLIGDKLEHAGLVTRSAHPDDRRSRVLSLTATGTNLRARLLQHLSAATPLPTLTARERHQLSQILSKLGGKP